MADLEIREASMYIRMCICMCLSYSPNKGGTTKPRYLAPAANSSYSRIARRHDI